MEFEKNGVHYSIIHTNDETSDGAKIFTYVAFNARGQMIDADVITASDIREAKLKILDR